MRLPSGAELAIVTGASSGIGAALLLAPARSRHLP